MVDFGDFRSLVQSLLTKEAHRRILVDKTGNSTCKSIGESNARTCTLRAESSGVAWKNDCFEYNHITH